MTKKQRLQENLYSFPYHYLDIFVEEYRKVRMVPYLEFLNYVIRKSAISGGDRILDAGCGDGRLVYELSLLGYRVDGVDYSAKAISFARAFNPNCEFYVQDLAKLQLPEKYDKIFCRETLEHIEPKKLPAVGHCLENSLKPGGYIIVSVPTTNAPVNPKHYQHFTKDKLLLVFAGKFESVAFFGVHRTGLCNVIYRQLERAGLLTNLLTGRAGFLRWLYHHFLLEGNPDDCLGIVAIFRNSIEPGSSRKKTVSPRL